MEFKQTNGSHSLTSYDEEDSIKPRVHIKTFSSFDSLASTATIGFEVNCNGHLTHTSVCILM